MRRSLALLCIFAVTGASALAQDNAPDGDAKKLQGKWTAKGPDGSPIAVAFDKEKVSITLIAPNGEETTISGDFKIDEKVTPRAMDWTNVKVRLREMPDLTAIYAFTDDNTLKLAGVGGTKRPKEFVEKGKELPGIRSNTMVLTRVKDEPKKDK